MSGSSVKVIFKRPPNYDVFCRFELGQVSISWSAGSIYSPDNRDILKRRRSNPKVLELLGTAVRPSPYLQSEQRTEQAIKLFPDPSYYSRVYRVFSVTERRKRLMDYYWTSHLHPKKEGGEDNPLPLNYLTTT